RSQVVLASQRRERLEHTREPRRLRKCDLRADRVRSPAVVDDVALVVEKDQSGGSKLRSAAVQPLGEIGGRVGAAERGARDRGRQALVEPHLHGGGVALPVELVLHAPVLEVAHHHPRQCAGEEEADGDDAGRGSEETESEGQLPASSSRYPTPQTVWMLGSVILAAASFSRTCCTCTSTVRV